MAIGGGFGTLIPVAMTLAGIVTMVRARARRRRGEAPPVDEDFEKRQAATRESERRMAAYLAQQGSGGHRYAEDDMQETRR